MLFCATPLSQYYFLNVNAPMPQMPHNDDRTNTRNNDATPLTVHQISLLVALSATVLSSLGFGLSIFVMWFGWLVPSTIPTPVSVTRVTMTSALRTRRRRVPNLPETQSPLEVDPALHYPNHVCSPHPALSYTTSESLSQDICVAEQVLVAGESLAQSRAQLPSPVDESSRSSSYTLVSNPIHVQMNVDTGDEPIVESDSSSRRSLSQRLPKMKNPFAGKARRRSANAETFSQNPPTDSNGGKAAKRPRINFGVVHSTTRTLDEAEPDPPSPKSSRLPFGRRNSKLTAAVPSTLAVSSDSVPSASTSCFSRKKHRRSSTVAPIPRTLPYEAPYFAAPPISLDATYLLHSKHPSSGNYMGLRSGPSSASEEQENDYPSPAQGMLGHRRSESTQKRRSVSDNLTTRRRTVQ